ncbi:MAG: hypothetical protein DYH03_06800 [Nitrospira sp. NTP1]|nr:hypothetical protein [Nitrospira sp. NTP1]
MQGCRDLLRTFTYEDVMAWLCYAVPLLFMIGPSAVMAREPLASILFHSAIGFSLSALIHRIGHALLSPLPKGPHTISLSATRRLPIRLTLSRFVWLLEGVVSLSLFCGVLAKRCWMAGGTDMLVVGGVLFLLAGALFFLPVRLVKLWETRYYPATSLVGPSDDVINQSLSGLPRLFK